jgi:hypothetical protein
VFMHAQKVILSHENIAHHIVSIRNENGHCICCADHIVYAVQTTFFEAAISTSDKSKQSRTATWHICSEQDLNRHILTSLD